MTDQHGASGGADATYRLAAAEDGAGFRRSLHWGGLGAPGSRESGALIDGRGCTQYNSICV